MFQQTEYNYLHSILDALTVRFAKTKSVELKLLLADEIGQLERAMNEENSR